MEKKTLKLTKKQFEGIIQEYAKKYNKTLQLEARKIEIENELKMLYEGDEEMVDEILGFGAKPNYAADAKKMLATGQKGMVDYAKKLAASKIEDLGSWATQIIGNPKGMLDYLNAKWEETYVANKGNMMNMKFNPKTGVYDKSEMARTKDFGTME